MNRLSEFLTGQRKLTPPDGMAAELEGTVMRRLHSSPNKLIRRRAFVVAFAGGAVTAALLFAFFRHKPLSSAAPPQFVESTMLLDDLTCIWLEPVDSPLSENSRP